MIIAVNTRLLLKNKLEGIGWFSYEVLKRISTSHPEHDFVFIFDRPFDESFIFSKNVTPVVIGPQARHPFLYILWFEFSIPHILKKYKADVFLSPDGYISLRTNVPTISVIHDLNFETYPQYLPLISRLYYKFFFPLFAKKAKRIITVSEYSKLDIHNLYGIDNEKIDVAYNGVKDVYHPISENEKTLVRSEISENEQYFVFVGALHPRKNLVGLFRAFDIYKKKSLSPNKLVIVGNKLWWTKPIKDTLNSLEFKNDITFLGHLSAEKLNKVVASSISMVYVSFFEGFGIPIIEAFKAETAVVTSNTTSMPEVAGDAAIIVNPFNDNEIADAMLILSENNEIRQDYIDKGRCRAKLFTWNKTADIVWQSIMKLNL